MDWLAAILGFLVGTNGPCKATVFGYEDDDDKGGEAVCLHRDLGPQDVGIAHRTLPCGTKVILINPRTFRSVVAKVVDHGPYGALLKGRWVIKRKSSDPGKWRGCVDLTMRTAKILRHNGFEDIIYAPVAQWESATLTRWIRWFDSTRGYHGQEQAQSSP